MSGPDGARPQVADHPQARSGALHWLSTRIRANPGLTVLLVLPLVIFAVPLVVGWVFLDGDNFLQNLPMRDLVGLDLRHGWLPLWNPYLFAGTPLLGGFNAGAAYPATWLMAVLPLFTAWTLTLALAFDVAVAGMWVFLRRQAIAGTPATFGAAVFGFAGYMTAQIVHIDLITGAAWLPWMLVAVHGLIRPPGGGAPPAFGWPLHRRSCAALLAVSLGMSLLAGAAEAIIDSAVLVILYAAGRTWTTGVLRRDNRALLVPTAVGLVAGVAGGVALGAAQWLPGLTFLSQSQRPVPSYSFFTSGSLPARMVVLVVSPFVLGTNQGQPGQYAGPYNFAEVTSYVGVLALIAACSLFLRRWRRRPEAREWWIWYVIAVVGLLTALGGETPLGHLMYLLPGIKSERLLNRNLLLVDVALAVLLAWWLQLVLATHAEGPATDHPTTRSRRAELAGRWRGGRRAELVVTCAPLVVITLLTLVLWIDGPLLERLLGATSTVATGTRVKVSLLVTGTTLVAGATTWVVVFRDRYSTRSLRRALALVVAVDLVLFDCFVIRPPTSEVRAQAKGGLAAAFRATTGDGRFIVYDPDQFFSNQLYQLGQTDLNLYTSFPSGQGYTALTDGNYFAATGAHYQETLRPSTLAGPVWDGLNVTTLLSLPGYFVTPVTLDPTTGTTSPRSPKGSLVPFPAHPAPSEPARTVTVRTTARPWYLGGVLTVTSVAVPVEGGRAPGLRVGLVTPTGGTRWLPSGDRVVVGGSTHRWVRVDLPGPTPAGGVVLASTGATTVGVPVVTTTQAGQVALDGRMQVGVTSPHWVFGGTIGPFGVFHDTAVRGWAWARGVSGGPPPAGTSVTAVAPAPNGGQHIAVRATGPALLVRSVSWSPGWRATVQSVTPTGRPVAGSARAATVGQDGVLQQVALPGAGTYVVSFRYAPTVATAGLVLSAVTAVVLGAWGLVEWVRVRRRRRLSQGRAA
jgi:hypothetical protein